MFEGVCGGYAVSAMEQWQLEEKDKEKETKYELRVLSSLFGLQKNIVPFFF